MMPFSAEFYREMDVKKDKVEGGLSSKPVSRTPSSVSISQQPQASVTTTSDGLTTVSAMYVSRLSENHVLVGVPETELHGVLYISGFATIRVLKGIAVVNGLTLLEHSPSEKILCPIWQPAYPILCRAGNIADNKKNGKVNDVLAAYLKQFNITFEDERGRKPYKQDLFNEFPVVISVQCLDNNNLEWLVAAEDQSMYAPEEIMPAAPHSITIYTSPSQIYRESDIAKVHTAMIGNFRGMMQNRADCMTLSTVWQDSSQTVCDFYRTSKKPTKTVLCGSKGVGKSTYLRYIANCLLSSVAERYDWLGAEPLATESTSVDKITLYSKAPVICILDCDLGQPELSTPGSVSLHVISRCTDAFLCAPHLNIKSADTSFYVGDVTNKYEPTLVLQFIQRLLDRYCEIVTKVAALREQEWKTATKKFVAKNAFNALMMDDSTSGSSGSESDHDFQMKIEEKTKGKDKSKVKSNNDNFPGPIPLLVNLDGYIKNMGAEVLEGILSMVKPTHAIHIASEKDRALIPLESVLGLNAIDSKTGASTRDGSEVESTMLECKILSLEPGRYYAAPRVAAVDLRSLRLISYFLRQDVSFSHLVRADLPKSSSRKSLSGLSRSSSCEQIKDNKGSNGTGGVVTTDLAAIQKAGPDSAILVRNGAIVDPVGLLAIQLVTTSPYRVPISRSVLCTIPSTSDLPPRLLLAALNASLVGIVLLPVEPVPTIMRKRLRHPAGEVEINFTVEIPVAPCIGMGIVRAVDLDADCIYLISSVSEQVLNRPSTKVCLVKGNNAQLPTVLTYSPLLPCFPYMSSESAGEGSAQLRTRNNVKRRAHQLNN